MKKKSEINRLAYNWARVLYVVLLAANQFAELVSKVVNYVRKFRKLQPLV